MPIKTKRPLKEPVPKKGAYLFLVGVDEEYTGSPFVSEVGEKKKPSFALDEDVTYEPSKLDIAKFKDSGFVTNLVADIDAKQIEDELIGWGLNFDLLSNEDGEIDFEQTQILNDYIEENADYVSLTIVDILSVVMVRCEFDWRRFTTILNEKNYDLLKLELAMRFHKRENVGNATAFVRF